MCNLSVKNIGFKHFQNSRKLIIMLCLPLLPSPICPRFFVRLLADVKFSTLEIGTADAQPFLLLHCVCNSNCHLLCRHRSFCVTIFFLSIWHLVFRIKSHLKCLFIMRNEIIWVESAEFFRFWIKTTLI